MSEERTIFPLPRDSAMDQIDLTAAEEALASQPLLIPIPKAAKLLGISRSAAYRCAATGDLPTRHLGGRVYIVTAKLRELLESA
jgi:predicted DNA-binding transcriptional regulator AlpA